MTGTRGDDLLFGSEGNDTLIAGAGDDVINAGLGDDLIVGARGFDTAVFSGSIFDYQFNLGRSGSLFVSGADGQDRLLGIEALQFDDYVVYADGRNNDPFVRDEAFALDENSSLHLTGLLDNDLDLDGDRLSISAVTQGTLGGSVALLSDGTVSYDTVNAFDWLAQGETATESFTYDVSDGRGGVRTATVELTITGVNDDVILQPSVLEGAVHELTQGEPGENSAILSSNGTLNFSDADLSDTHTVGVTALGTDYLGSFTVATPTGTDQTTDGSVAWTFDVADDVLDSLAEGETLIQSYLISIDDGHGSVLEETVTVTITGANEAPVTTDVIPLNAMFLFGHPVNFSGAGFFIDPNGDALSYSAINLPAGLSIDAETGQVTGVLDPDAQTGPVEITFTATDTYGASEDRVVNVSVPDPTPVAIDDHFTISSGLVISGDLSLNDPAASNPFTLQPIYEHTYSLTSGVVSAGPSAGNASVVINPDGTFTYTADPRVFGSDQFAYTITDEFGHESTAVVTIDIPQQTAVPVAGELGDLTVDGIDMVRGSGGRPTDLGTVELRIPLSELTGLMDGSSQDLLSGLLVGRIVDPDSGLVFEPTNDPAGTTRIEGNDLVLTVSRSLLDDTGAPTELQFSYGYPIATELHTTVNLSPEGDGYPTFNLIVDGVTSEPVTFTPQVTFIDDRAEESPDGGVVVGGISGPGLLDGQAGANGQLGLLLDNNEVIPLYDGPNYVFYAFVSFGEVLIHYFEDIAFRFANGFDIYQVTDGADGQDNPNTQIGVVGGGDAPVVAFGADGADAGNGGDGGDGSNGGDGYIEPFTPLAAFTVDGPDGGDGGDGGDGADTLYQIVGSNFDDVIVGGNGGNAGHDGAVGADGLSGADVENTYSGGISGGEVAEGGAGGNGGAGGAGGDAIYTILTGDGDDEIWGGNAGASGETGVSLYFMAGGEGNDTITAGADLHNAEIIGGQSTYVLSGGGGDDVFVFNDQNLVGSGNGLYYEPGVAAGTFGAGIQIAGGEGFDTLAIESTSNLYEGNGVALGDIPWAQGASSNHLITDIEMIRTDTYSEVILFLTADFINEITTEVDGMHTLYVDEGAYSRVYMDNQEIWTREDDAITRDGVVYDMLVNEATHTTLYLASGDHIFWI